MELLVEKTGVCVSIHAKICRHPAFWDEYLRFGQIIYGSEKLTKLTRSLP